MTSPTTRHRFTVDDYYKMAEAGILTEDSRVELIDGEVVEMPPIGPLHQGTVDVIAELFYDLFRGRARVRTQGPVRLNDHSLPEPDVALLHLRQDRYLTQHPTPNEVFLLVEVGDSTAEDDRRRKIPLYGLNGIPELWLINLHDETITVCREPYARGYRSLRTLLRGDRIAPLAFPNREIAVTDILGDSSPA